MSFALQRGYFTTPRVSVHAIKNNQILGLLVRLQSQANFRATVIRHNGRQAILPIGGVVTSLRQFALECGISRTTLVKHLNWLKLHNFLDYWSAREGTVIQLFQQSDPGPEGKEVRPTSAPHSEPGGTNCAPPVLKKNKKDLNYSTSGSAKPREGSIMIDPENPREKYQPAPTPQAPRPIEVMGPDEVFLSYVAADSDIRKLYGIRKKPGASNTYVISDWKRFQASPPEKRKLLRTLGDSTLAKQEDDLLGLPKNLREAPNALPSGGEFRAVIAATNETKTESGSRLIQVILETDDGKVITDHLLVDLEEHYRSFVALMESAGLTPAFHADAAVGRWVKVLVEEDEEGFTIVDYRGV